MTSLTPRGLVSNFKNLGWDQAKPEEALDLPLGTPAQQRIIRPAIEKGICTRQEFQLEFDRQSQGENLTFDSRMLSLYYVRLGVKPELTANFNFGTTHKITAACVAEQGTDYIRRFVLNVKDKLPALERPHLQPDSNAIASVFLINSEAWENEPIPTDIGYLNNWAMVATAALGGKELVQFKGRAQLPSGMVLHKRFYEHAEAAHDQGLRLYGPLGYALVMGLKRRYFPRKEPIRWFMEAFAIATRPPDARHIVDLLHNHARLTDKELLTHRKHLQPAFAASDAHLLGHFGHRLLTLVNDEELVQFAVGALRAPNTDALRLVVESLAKRERPTTKTVQALQWRLKELAGHTDPEIAAHARNILEKWQVPNIPTFGDTTANPNDTLWQPTPKLWQAPRFTAGAVSPFSIREHLEQLPRTPGVSDLNTEQFLSKIVTLANENLESAQTILADYDSLFKNRAFLARQSVAISRELEALDQLGTMPCLLSEPSYVDLRITAADLVTRLERYRDAKAEVAPIDLYLALLRLDVTTIDIETITNQLAHLSVPIARRYGVKGFKNASEVVRDYLYDPFAEPPLIMFQIYDKRLVPAPTHRPQSLFYCYNPSHWWISQYGEIDPGVYPMWEDSAWISMRWGRVVDPIKMGLLAQQAAHRSRPFGPGLAMNMLAMQRPSVSGEFEGAWEAMILSWERGLLRPNIADPALLDWRFEIDNYYNFCDTFVKIAHEGMLSVVWPLLDRMLTFSKQERKLVKASFEVSEAMAELAPEVTKAIAAGAAPPEVAIAPGLRWFAVHNGRGRVYRAAQAAIRRLPEVRIEE